jgi:hypothetical protein
MFLLSLYLLLASVLERERQNLLCGVKVTFHGIEQSIKDRGMDDSSQVNKDSAYWYRGDSDGHC